MIKSTRSAFTLVELSIVLVIIGLLVGGVLTGQTLIRAAELRSVTTQYQRYQAATMTFRDKYFALPGDMTNATAYWGIAAGSTGNDSTCAAASSSTAATCNGNGDGQIIASTGSNENLRFWQHLANAGLIEGSYNGVLGTGGNALNIPAGRISSSFWWINAWNTLAANTAAFDGQYGNAFEVGGLLSGADPQTPIFKPEEAYNIDVKLDDGKPAMGNVVIRAKGGLNTCTDASASTTMTASYLLTGQALTCALFFRQQF